MGESPQRALSPPACAPLMWRFFFTCQDMLGPHSFL